MGSSQPQQQATTSLSNDVAVEAGVSSASGSLLESSQVDYTASFFVTFYETLSMFFKEKISEIW